ncbi:MAG TPA: hypothetical protein VFF67_00875 [Thermoplasmata archaeon]|nr:hypothetical protein [Thermoplasmata archaeon]
MLEGIAKVANEHRHRRWVGYGAVGAAGAVALLMALSSMAGAVTPHVFTAPYKHTAVVIYRSASISGNCPSSAGVSAQHWIPKTGNVTGLAAASANSCVTNPVGNGYTSGYTFAETDVYFPIKVANGAHNLSVNTSFDFTLIVKKAGNFACGLAPNVPGTYTYRGCYYDVSVGSSWRMELYDATNFSFLYGSHDYVNGPANYSFGSNYSYCNGAGSCSSSNYSSSCPATNYQCVPAGTMAMGSNDTWIDTGANCAYSYAGHCYSWHNWTLNGTHKYWIAIYFDFYADAYLAGYGKGQAVAVTFNGATLGNTGWKITSVTVT